MFIKKRGNKAFTLAEVLITLVIIGAVAAMTIPSLVNNIGDQQNKVAWKKAFADISQAANRLSADNGGTLNGVFSSSDSMKYGFLKYLNYTKSCEEGKSLGNCWAITGKYLDGSPISPTDYAGAVLSNGILLRFQYHSNNCSHTGWGMPICGAIYVDVNGFNGPTIWGKDLFAVIIQSNSTKPTGVQGDTVVDHECNVYGLGCSAVYLYQ